MTTPKLTTAWLLTKYKDKQFVSYEDQIVTEYPLTIYLNGEEFATLVCSPTHLEEMTVGFLASEGVIRRYDEIKSLNIDDDQGLAYVELHHPSSSAQTLHSKRFIGSCCGKSRQSFYFYNDVRTAKTVVTKLEITAETCLALMAEMQNQSKTFKTTGGVHNAALCSTEGILITRTDIGRHNTLDKLYGHCLMHRIPVRDKIITFSGRISSEVLLKVSKMGIGILLSKSAPTELALRMADELNITTVGFIRGNQMNIYTHPERILL
ncbi:Protein fdhD [Caldalkalibacillus thermarum TA2.A1]|uniref:Sulfur carrier protein FdhD n=1 Tax=Caldalkalibacillus thermarum (strain TA2.A1) TaxID=986075 RepID=F5L7E5_CALTT|nr:formate dehydrogenase accessory sulfurtransferase FdhD [Caldalkalibacillus thermarum]EGL82737.1 Protein fdhD [Caldalkalibacillus thermarum TA2.A1]QZT32565.1 formate dehydrogenase accessory sulfurtransferase FdhD [Caldalkalibacillus thermarum TA2.A1]